MLSSPLPRPVPRVSVVIPVWNGRDHLPECLASLRAQTWQDFECIVVDNASPDGAGDWVAKDQPWATLLRMPRNLGFAGGTNAGLRAARGELLVTLNQDTRADPRFLEEMVAASGGERVGMVACKMRFLHDPGALNSTGVLLTRDLYGLDRGIGERDAGQWDAPGEVFGPCGGAALYARAMLDEVGLFDEAFFCYYEDLDLAWRARLAGWRCAYAPRAVVEHKHRSSGHQRAARDVPRHVIAWCERNRVWMLAKNAGAGTLLRQAPLLLAAEARVLGEAALGDALKLRAQLEALRALRPVLAQRRAIRARRRVPERAVRAWVGLGKAAAE